MDEQQINSTIDARPLDVNSLFAMGIRGIGVIILLLGLWAGSKVFSEGWHLYTTPGNITKWAEAVEQGSNIDRYLLTISNQLGRQTGENPIRINPQEQARVSYFAAWSLVILLLLVLGRLALWAIFFGGKLALYNADSEKIAREMVKETIRQLRNDYG